MSSSEDSPPGIESPQEGTTHLTAVSPEMDRLNSSVFFISNILIFLAAPVFYVDVVQATLCDKLGASHTVASLPASAALFASFAPIFLVWMIPYRLERGAVVASNLVTAVLLVAVSAALVLPVNNTLRIAAVIAQGLAYGVTGAISQIYMFVCLGRGCTTEGRARAYKLAYTVGPIAAVVGSLGAQFVLNRGISFLVYPYDFAALYFLGAVCALGITWASTRYKLVHVPEENRPPLFRFMLESAKSYISVRPLVMLFFGYALWYSTLMATSNLSLYTRQAVGREPASLSGFILALRFGFKSVGGYFLGSMTARWGDRAPVVATVLLVGGATLWAWVAPGYWYLLAFGFMGAGELGGNYFPNYLLPMSAPTEAARNQAIITLAGPLVFLAPALHGALTEHFGYRGSFLFGTITAAIALWLVLQLPARPAAVKPAGGTEHASAVA